MGVVYEDLFFKFGFGYVDVLIGRTGHVLELLLGGLQLLALGLIFLALFWVCKCCVIIECEREPRLKYNTDRGNVCLVVDPPSAAA